MKHKMKRFWTLNRHHEAGFTLVELIVVIAILAILAGVAVPAYSGYVKKANMQADISLISEIEQALTLAGYKGTFANGEGGYLILSADGEVQGVTADSNLEKALIDAFGSEYADVLKLKYDAWSNNGLFAGLMYGQAQDVYNSTYYGSSDKLMGQVKEITDAAWNILGRGEGEATRAEMIAMFADGDMTLDDAAQAFGYDSIDDVPDEAMPNLMVLAISADVTNGIQNGDSYEMSAATHVIYDFALYNGYASTAAGKTAAEGGTSFADAYNTFIAEISVAPGVKEVAAAYNKLKDAADTEEFDSYCETQSQTDLAAFSAMMSGLAGATAQNNAGVTEGLKQDDFFTAGLGNDLFNTYIDSVDAAAGLPPELWDEIIPNCENGVVVFYSLVQNMISTGNTLPVD